MADTYKSEQTNKKKKELSDEDEGSKIQTCERASERKKIERANKGVCCLYVH